MVFTSGLEFHSIPFIGYSVHLLRNGFGIESVKISSDIPDLMRSDRMLFPIAWGLGSGDGDSSGGPRNVAVTVRGMVRGKMVRVRVLKLSLTLRLRRLTLGD